MNRISFRIPQPLLDAIDRKAGKEERSTWIRRVLSKAVRLKVEPVKRGRPVTDKT